MPKIQIEAHLSSADLLKAVEQLPTEELDTFVMQVVAFQKNQQSASAMLHEETLQAAAQTAIPHALLTRYRELIALRRDERLTPAEYAELLQIGDDIESFHLKRMTNLVELAQLRGVSLDYLMQELGVHPEPYE